MCIRDSSYLKHVKGVLRKSEAVLLIYRILKDGLSWQSSTRNYRAAAWKNTEYFIRKMSDLAANHNAKFVVIIFPYRDQIEGRMDFREQVKLKQILEKNQVEYFDPSFVLSQNKNSVQDASNLYHDSAHPNKLGTLVIANAFSDYFVEKFLNTDD